MLRKKKEQQKILLEQFLKSYEIYYGEDSAICLINDILTEEQIDFLPEQLQQISKRRLRCILSDMIKKDWNKTKDLPEYELKPLNKYIHVKVSKKRVACASLISAVTLASIISIGAISSSGKAKQGQQVGSVRGLELYNEATDQNIESYTLNKEEKSGAIKPESILSDNSQAENKKTNLEETLETSAELTTEKHISNENTSVNNKDTLEENDEVVKIINNSKEPVEEIVSTNTTKDILKLFNRELRGEKLTEKDLEIMSQVDEDLMIIQSEGENYNQITKDYIVTTEENGTIKIVHSMTDIEKDFLTNQKINSIPNLVDFTTVGDFIEQNAIEKSGYKLSNNTFWGYKNIQEIDDLYGTEIVSCIQKYGLPIPVYQAKDFNHRAGKTTSFAKK